MTVNEEVEEFAKGLWNGYHEFFPCVRALYLPKRCACAGPPSIHVWLAKDTLIFTGPDCNCTMNHFVDWMMTIDPLTLPT